MNRNYTSLLMLFIGVGIGIVGVFALHSPDIEEKIITLDPNPALELRLQEE